MGLRGNFTPPTRTFTFSREWHASRWNPRERPRDGPSVVKNARRANGRWRAPFAEEGTRVVFRKRWNEDDYYDDDDGRWQRIAKPAAVVAVAVVLAIAGILVVRQSGDSSNAGGVATSGPTTSSATDSTPGPFDPIDPAKLDATSRPTSDSVAADSTDPVDGSGTIDSTLTTGGTYTMTPDGQPQPVTVTMRTDSIQVSGSVPSETARTQLTSLLTGISDGTIPIADDMTVNPSVPIGVAVRIVPLDASAYASGAFNIEAGHAASIDRVVRLMKVVVHASLLVVTHTDPLEAPPGVLVLSAARLAAETAYLADAGIAADRLSWRAVGSTDVLTAETTPEALAENRRTEYIVSGLFVTP
jgi:outer membrane protein OmpA-like peptidoglycan-associated protein